MLVIICRWIVGAFLCLLSIGAFASHDYIAAFIVLACGFFALPLRKTRAKQSNQPPISSSPPIYTPMEDKKQTPMFVVQLNKSTNENDSRVDDTIIDVSGSDQKIRYDDFPIKVEVHVQTSPSNSGYPYEQPRLGDKYKQKLGLTTQEVSWLNKLWDPTNVFLAIEGCCMATIKLYLMVVKGINKELTKNGSSLAKEVAFFQEELKKSYTAVSWSYYDPSYVAERTQTDIYQTVFKRAEKAVRLAFGHKRQVTGEFPYSDQRLKAEFENRIGEKADRLIEQLSKQFEAPDEATEVLLNAQNVTRWKGPYEQLTKSFTDANKFLFIDGIHKLAQANCKNPSIENIFFEASKFIAKYDKEQSLKLYVHYLYHDLKSDKFDDRQLTKTIQKSLFKTDEQLHDFQLLVGELIKTNDLETALLRVGKIYQPKRKKIQLDKDLITEVQQQDRIAVELLNEYLQDDTEVNGESRTAIEAHNGTENEEVTIQIAPKQSPSSVGRFIRDIMLNKIQEAALLLFASRSFSIPQSEIEAYCKANNVFKNQLIDSINEACYEVIDDVLIEEDGDSYTIHESYYQKIAATC